MYVVNFVVRLRERLVSIIEKVDMRWWTGLNMVQFLMMEGIF